MSYENKDIENYWGTSYRGGIIDLSCENLLEKQKEFSEEKITIKKC